LEISQIGFFKTGTLIRALRRRAADVNLWAPPSTIFNYRRAAADNLSARRRCNVGVFRRKHSLRTIRANNRIADFDFKKRIFYKS